MKRPVTFYSEGCKLVGDIYYPDGLRPGEKRAGSVRRPDEWYDLLARAAADRSQRALTGESTFVEHSEILLPDRHRRSSPLPLGAIIQQQ